MDILIDLIIWLIKNTTKPRVPTAPNIRPANQQELDRQKAEVERRIREMQNALAQQTGRAAPVAQKTRKVKRTVKQAAPAPLPTPTVVLQRWNEPQVSSVPVVEHRGSTATLTQKSFIVPLLLGEILAPPLALREDGF